MPDDAPWLEPGISEEERIVRYLDANPNAGNRKIAAELGISVDSVRARRGLKHRVARPVSKSSNAAPEKWEDEANATAGSVVVREISERTQQQTEWDIAVGEMVRSWIEDRGLKFEVPKSSELVLTSLNFWFRYRDEIGAAERRAEQAEAEVRELRSILDPVLFKRAVFSAIARAVVLSSMNGSPMSEQSILALMKAADEVYS